MKCWICAGDELILIRKSSISEKLSSNNFKISDSSYGLTGDVYQCQLCDLIFCPAMENVLTYYEQMVDTDYIDSSEARYLQAKNILQRIKKYKPDGATFLDVGAGTGLLVDEASKNSYDAWGIEPAEYLCNEAKNMRRRVVQGTLPNTSIPKQFNVVALVDVIEHVSDPKGLLREIHNVMTQESIGLLITPDVGSFFAKLLRWKWWHFRIAHIAYFDLKTLTLLLKESGFNIIEVYRPSWYLPLNYVLVRLLSYLMHNPEKLIPKFFGKKIIKFNLYDSYGVVFKRS